MENDRNNDNLVNQFRLVIENVATVQQLKKSLEEIQRQVDLLSKRGPTRSIAINTSPRPAPLENLEQNASKGAEQDHPNNKTESKGTGEQEPNIKTEVQSAKLAIPSVASIKTQIAQASYKAPTPTKSQTDVSPSAASLKQLVIKAVDNQNFVSSNKFELFETTLYERLESLERELSYQQDTHTEKINLVRGEANDSKKLLASVLEQNKGLTLANQELKDLLNEITINYDDLKKKHNHLTLHVETMLGPIGSSSNDEEPNGSVMDELKTTIVTMKVDINKQNTKVEKLTKSFNSSTGNVEKIKEDVLIVKNLISSMSNEKYNHYLQDADPELVMKDTILSLHNHWKLFGTDFEHAVNNLVKRKNTLNEDPFITASIKLLKESKHILSVLALGSSDPEDAMNDNEFTSVELFEKVYPFLNNVVLMSHELMKLDDDSKSGAITTTFTFNDMTSSDGLANVRDKLSRINDITKSALDLKVDKIGILTRVDHIEKVAENSVTRAELADQLDKIKAILTSKADMATVENITATKASVKELRKLKEKLLAEGVPQSVMDDTRTAGIKSSFGDEEDSNVFSRKFEALHKEFQDLKAFSKQYVPREEVNEAMQSVIQEIKQVKLNSVGLSNFNAALKTKADDTQVQRLITALRGAMGNLEARNSAAGYLRCLLCDKPVNNVTAGFDDPINAASREQTPDKRRGNNNQSDKTPDRLRPATTERARPSSIDESDDSIKRSASLRSQKFKKLPKLADFDDELTSMDGSKSEVNLLRASLDLPVIGGDSNNEVLF